MPIYFLRVEIEILTGHESWERIASPAFANRSRCFHRNDSSPEEFSPQMNTDETQIEKVSKFNYL